jgi:hypothetical protein
VKFRQLGKQKMTLPAQVGLAVGAKVGRCEGLRVETVGRVKSENNTSSAKMFQILFCLVYLFCCNKQRFL